MYLLVNSAKFAIIFTMLLIGLHLITPDSEANNPSVPSVATITAGMHIVPTWHYGREINLVNGLTNNKIGLVLVYTNWAHSFQGFVDWLFNSIRDQIPEPADRPVVLLAWEPTDGRTSVEVGPGCNGNYNGFVGYSTILNGNCDNYIRAYARQMKARPERILIKFAHEMNITSRPWWPGHSGYQSAIPYVNMYRHVRDIFNQEGVTNVEWVWAPVAVYDPRTTWNKTSNYYPGDTYVDWVGPMHYNYYNQFDPPGQWQPFTSLFDSVLKEFACSYLKPQIIHEMGSVDGEGGSNTKVNWIADAYAKAPLYPFLRAIIWLNTVDNLNPNADFRITDNTGSSAGQFTPANVNPLPQGSGAWTTAYANAMQSSVYTKTLPSLAQTTPASPVCPYKSFLPVLIK